MPPKSKTKAKRVAKPKTMPKVRRARPQPKASGGLNFLGKATGFLGDLAQKAIQTITGMGDYTVHENTLFSGAVSQSGPPTFARPTDPGCTRIVHREFFSDVVSPGAAFNINTFVINPTNVAMFPWLSLMAQNFEQYRFYGLVFEFKTTSATAVSSTNTALGSVILATQYNILEPPFASKVQMDSYDYAVSTNPSISCIHPIECAPKQGAMVNLYTFTSAAGDNRFSDLGNFSIATQGQQATSDIGELWVSYDIEFLKPRLGLPVSGLNQAYLASFTGSLVTTATNILSLLAAPTTGNFVPNLLLVHDGPSGPGTLAWPSGVIGSFYVNLTCTFSGVAGGPTDTLLATTASTGMAVVDPGFWQPLVPGTSTATVSNIFSIQFLVTVNTQAYQDGAIPFLAIGPNTGLVGLTMTSAQLIVSSTPFTL